MNDARLLIFFVVFGLLIPTLILTLAYHFCWFVFRSNIKGLKRLIPGRAALWQGLFGTLLVGTAFILLTPLLWTGCSAVLDTAIGREVEGCAGRSLARLAKSKLSLTPFFGIWLTLAAYGYQVEFLVSRRLMPKPKQSLQANQVKPAVDAELEELKKQMRSQRKRN